MSGMSGGTPGGTPVIMASGRCMSEPDGARVAEYMRRMSVRHKDAISCMHLMLAQVRRAHPAIGCRIRFFGVTSRTKSVYSTWMKMQRLNCPIEDILDLVAVRVVVECVEKADDESMCYKLLDLVHTCYVPVPLTTKDFISVPKPNGYRSLHSTVMVCDQAVEVQIRTADMHDVAECGTAAHGVYKATQYRN